MNLQRLDSLRNSLIDQGYSKSYATQLVEELDDHYQCIAEEQRQHSHRGHSPNGDGRRLGDTATFGPYADRAFLDSASHRIGTNAEIMCAVDAQVALQPWSKQHPLFSFLVCPALLICVFTIASMWLAIQLFGPASERATPILVNSFGLANGLIPLIITLAVLIMSRRVRAGHWLTIGSVAMISMGSFFMVDVVFCQQSNSSFCHLHWGFDPLQFSLPFAALAIGLICVAGNRVRKLGMADSVAGSSTRPKPRIAASWPTPSTISSSAGGFPIKRVFAVVALCGGLVAMFLFLVERTADYVRPHEYDSIVHSRSQPHTRGANVIGLVRRPDIRAELALTDGQLQIVDQAIADFDATHQQIWDTYLAEQESKTAPMPIDNERLKSLIISTHDSVVKTLAPDQRARLTQLEYSQLGWDMLFLKEVRQKLGLSRRQFTRIKDLNFDHTQQMSALRRKWSQADTELKPAVAKEISAAKSRLGQRISAVLTRGQIESIDRMKGQPLSE